MPLQEKKYAGVVVPMISPFHSDFSVDTESAAKIAMKISDAGAAPFILGSTGEGTSMSVDQKEVLLRSVVKAVYGRALVYAGLNSNSLVSAVEEGKLFESCGADVLVATLPFYYPVDEEQMFRFFEQLADKLPLPLILYNMPGMVKHPIPLTVADRLSRHPNITGMKDSERNKERLEKSVALWKNRKDFSFLIGWAAMSSTGLQLGADGIIPSSGNICAGLYTELYKAAKNGDIEKAGYLQEKANRVSELYQKDKDLSHSIPALKLILEKKKLCSSVVLPPMYKMDEKENYVKFIERELKKLNL